jgi:membrane fusion protein, heavy metal efflux system
MRNLIMWWAKSFQRTSVSVGMLCLLALQGCQNHKLPDAVDEKKSFVLSDVMLSKIKLDTVHKQKVYGVLNLNGKIVADESREVEIFPIVGGNVMEVYAGLGDFVKKGQTLGVIRSGEVAEFDRQRVDAQSDVLVAQKNLAVKQDLFDSKLSSERELVAAQKELEKAEAAVKRIEETFSIYNFNDKSEYHLKAPISGFVIKKNINRDMTLPFPQTESVFTIAELNEVWAVANVYESDISLISEGMDVVVSTLSYPNDTIKAKVDKILNMLDPATKTMKIRIRIQNPDFKLKPEMLATVRVFYHENDSLMSVPASSIVFDNSRQFVMVYKDKYNIETREVEIHKTTGRRTWLSSGVAENEVVISKNQLFIYDALND